MQLSEEHCWVGLTAEVLDAKIMMDRVRSPKAGAIVLFAGKGSIKLFHCFSSWMANSEPGTTRDNFDGKPVKELQYEAYVPKALRTMLKITKDIAEKHSLTSIAMIHRLGVVPIGEESIYITVSSPHRQAAWRAGEEALERCKDEVEVWKKEEFEGEEGIWRANRDGKTGIKITPSNNTLPPDGEAVLRPKSYLEKGHGPVVRSKKS